MKFSFTEEQHGIAAAARDLLARECSPAVIRAEWEGAPRTASRWRRLADMGVLGLLVPVEWGGLGLDEVDAVLLLEETGRHALPDPLVETTLVAAPLLRDVAPPSTRDRWLRDIVAGRARVSIGLAAGGPYIADADSADLLLLQDGTALHAVSPSDVQLTRQPSMDGARRAFTVDWSPQPSTTFVDGPEALDAINAAFDRATLGIAAQLIGLSDRMVAMATEYARNREQFGRPIGSFQAIQHRLADALLALDFARPVVYRAAWTLARNDPNRSRDASMAKVFASTAADKASRAALQTHGAIGYTWEHDLHLWMKRAWVLSKEWGGVAWHRDRVAECVFEDTSAH
jgi:alkylation response protein AidB-like acyl-CoA dehydrogenase